MNVPKKHRELADELFDIVKAAFPDVRLLSMHTSPEDENEIWVHVLVSDEDMMYPVIQCASEFAVDKLVETGYSVSVIPHLDEHAVSRSFF
jgi:hypothetical protein